MLLFEREDVCAVAKEPGVSMATSARNENSAQEAIDRLLGAERAALGPLFLVHRLDLGTSGVVLLARNESAHRVLTSAFQNRRVRKTYRAIAWGHPRPARGIWTDTLGRDRKDGRKMTVRADGKKAVTRYQTLTRLPSVADLKLQPETGRTHQIRVHLAAHGHPIVGDALYGGATRWRGVRSREHRQTLAGVGRPLLHAEQIEIPDMDIDVTAPMPEDYARVLARLTPSPAGRDGDKLPDPSFRR
jgi:23S rRNA pseudouridine1911/1915/1917 synthase